MDEWMYDDPYAGMSMDWSSPSYTGDPYENLNTDWTGSQGVPGMPSGGGYNWGDMAAKMAMNAIPALAGIGGSIWANQAGEQAGQQAGTGMQNQYKGMLSGQWGFNPPGAPSAPTLPQFSGYLPREGGMMTQPRYSPPGNYRLDPYSYAGALGRGGYMPPSPDEMGLGVGPGGPFGDLTGQGSMRAGGGQLPVVSPYQMESTDPSAVFNAWHGALQPGVASLLRAEGGERRRIGEELTGAGVGVGSPLVEQQANLQAMTNEGIAKQAAAVVQPDIASRRAAAASTGSSIMDNETRRMAQLIADETQRRGQELGYLQNIYGSGLNYASALQRGLIDAETGRMGQILSNETSRMGDFTRAQTERAGQTLNALTTQRGQDVGLMGGRERDLLNAMTSIFGTQGNIYGTGANIYGSQLRAGGEGLSAAAKAAGEAGTGPANTMNQAAMLAQIIANIMRGGQGA